MPIGKIDPVGVNLPILYYEGHNLKLTSQDFVPPFQPFIVIMWKNISCQVMSLETLRKTKSTKMPISHHVQYH